MSYPHLACTILILAALAGVTLYALALDLQARAASTRPDTWEE